jgi:hypothetical protein
MHHKPILNLLFPLFIHDSSRSRETELPQYPAEHHAHLHQRQILTGTHRRAVRKGEKRARVVFSCRRALAEPSFGEERIGRVEVSRVSMYAVCMKGELCPLGDDSAIG